jgi:hypothetical protein
MAQTSLVGSVLFPSYPSAFSTTPSFASALLDATGEKAGAVFQAPKTGNIRRVGLRFGTVTTATDTDIRIETVNSSGQPSGTLWNSPTNTTLATIPAASIVSNTWVFSPNLTADAAVTQGDFLAVMVAPTGTPNLNMSYSATGFQNIPYVAAFLNGAWTLVDDTPVFAIEYSDGSYGTIPGMYPWTVLASVSFNSGSTPDERGLYFRLPVPTRCRGVVVIGDLDSDATVRLYDADGSAVLQSASHVAARRGSTAAGWHYFLWGGTQPLLANTFYRATLLPGAGNIAQLEFEVNAAAQLGQIAGGADMHLTTRTDAGAWTQTTNRRPFMMLLLDAFDDGVGGGGGVTLTPHVTSPVIW